MYAMHVLNLRHFGLCINWSEANVHMHIYAHGTSVIEFKLLILETY